MSVAASKTEYLVLNVRTSFEELEKFTGSKYVKSNPSGTYKKVQELLKKKKRFCLLALPCQVGALKTVIKENDNFVYSGSYLSWNAIPKTSARLP